MPNDWTPKPPYPYDSGDNKVDTPAHRTRRQVLRGAVGAVIVAVIGYVSWTRYFFPPGSPAPFAGQNGGADGGMSGGARVDLGSVSKYESSKAPVQVAVNNQVAFVEASGSAAPKVLSGVCTHQGCAVAWDGAEQQYVCPCQNSLFARDGSVVQGPATRPLMLIPSTVDEGNLYAQPVTS